MCQELLESNINKGKVKPIEVLLIEDDLLDTRIVKEFLKQSKDTTFNVTHVELLLEGKKEIANKEFDVVILDLGLPDCTGLSTFTKLRENSPELPIIILTGSTKERTLFRQHMDRIEEFHVKGSVDSDSLIKTIHEVIKCSQTRKRLQTHFVDSTIKQKKEK